MNLIDRLLAARQATTYPYTPGINPNAPGPETMMGQNPGMVGPPAPPPEMKGPPGALANPGAGAQAPRQGALDAILGAFGKPGKQVQDFIKPGTDALSGVLGSFQGAAERGQLGAIAPRFQAGVNAAQERAMREMQIKSAENFRLSGGESPSAVREYEFYKSLSPEAQDEYLKVKRAYGVDRVYGVGNVDNRGNVITPEGQVVDARSEEARQITEAEEDARTAAIPEREQTKAQAEAKIALSDYAIDFERRKARIMQLRNHPGMRDRVGLKSASSLFGLRDTALPNTRGAGFDALLEEVEGGVFAEAYETLKGGGTITEIETAKAQQALTRIGNTDQKEEDWLAAVDDFLQAMDDGYRKLEKAASGDFEVSSAPIRIRYDSQGNRID